MQVTRLAPAVVPPGEAAGGMPAPSLQLASAYASAALPALRQWDALAKGAGSALEESRRQVDLGEQALQESRAQLEAVRRTSPTSQGGVEAAEASLARIDARPWRFLRFVWMWIWGAGWRQEREAARMALSKAQESRRQANQALEARDQAVAHAESVVEQARSRLTGAVAEEARLSPMPQVVEGLAFIDYTWLPILIEETEKAGEVSRRWLLVDAHGRPRQLTIPVVKDSKDLTANLEEAIGRLDFNRVLLDPGEAGGQLGAWNQLFGSEYDLREAAIGIARFIKSISATQVEYSVADVRTATGRLLQERGARITQLRGGAAAAILDRHSREVLSEVEKSADGLRSAMGVRARKTRDFYAKLADTAQRLRQSVADAKRERSEATGYISDRIRESRLDSVLVRYHLYCPQCNATPLYLETGFEITEKMIAEVRTSELKPRAEAYLRQRLNSKEGKRNVPDEAAQATLEEGWDAAFADLSQLESDVRQRESEIAERRDSGDPQDQLHVRFASQDAANCRRWYRQAARKLLRTPFEPWQSVLEPQIKAAAVAAPGKPRALRAEEPIDPNTKLGYEPDVVGEPWRCPRCATDFPTDVALQGAVDRLRWDVVYPMVRTLWGQEAIWSKTIDALENASREMRDRVEQEIKAMQGPIDNFRADIRVLRNRLDEANAHGAGLRQRLDDMVTHFERLGLLTGDQLESVKVVHGRITERMDLVRGLRKRLDAVESGMEQTIRKVWRRRELPADPGQRFLDADAARGLLGRRGLLAVKWSLREEDFPSSGPWVCGQCGHANAATGQFCGGCGDRR